MLETVLRPLRAITFVLVILYGLLPTAALADVPDRFIGDTAIYSALGNENYPRPNVLFIIDNNSTMGNQAGTGAPYDPARTYSGTYVPWSIYKLTGQGNMTMHKSLANQTEFNTFFTGSTKCTEAKTALLNYGTYTGTATTGLKSDGSCGNGGADVVYLGNLLNYQQQPQGTPVTGVLTFTQGSFDVVGAGTHFTSEPAAAGLAGYEILVDGIIYTVDTVTDDTHMSIYQEVPDPADPTGTTLLHLPFQSATGSTYTVLIPSTTNRQVDILIKAVENVVGGKLNAASFGMMVIDKTKKGGSLVYPVTKLDTNKFKNEFVPKLNWIASNLTDGEGRPLSAILYDAGMYFRGTDRFPLSQEFNTAPSPIVYPCQQNYVFILTNGDVQNENKNAQALNDMKIKPTDIGGDVDHDGMEPDTVVGVGGTHYLDDVAKYLYETDSKTGTVTVGGVIYDFDDEDYRLQNITTHTVLVFSPYKEIIERAADSSHGRGTYHVASTASQLQKALEEALAGVFNVANSSFVAPVVPVSPENRTYSGSRVYMGFFKPQSNKAWLGNVKKFGIDSDGNIVDVNGELANFVDMDGDFYDDRDGKFLDKAKNGAFRPCALSYWSTAVATTPPDCYGDSGEVDRGGIGEKLLERSVPRNIYTYFPGAGGSIYLANSVNAFKWENVYVPAGNPFGLPAQNGKIDAVANLDLGSSPNPYGTAYAYINWIRGMDRFDEDGDGIRTDNRQWMMGDVLHSKPLIVNYSSFLVSGPSGSANEASCSTNKNVIFVGANDGMLHAFSDCNGQELWGFIPFEMLTEMKWLVGAYHQYYVDSSISALIIDKNKDGNLRKGDGDTVWIMFGVRRGLGKNRAPGNGIYYVLNVIEPENPIVLWRFKTGAADFTEMGESWSEPKIGKMLINGDTKLVAFMGAGYDNCNEDARYGNNQKYPGECAPMFVPDAGIAVSSPSGAASSPLGRGIYVIELLQINADGSLSFANGGKVLWSYGYQGMKINDLNMEFAIMSELAPIDSDYDGYVDRIYAGDAGGNVWRFEVKSENPTSWWARKLFASNPESAGSDVGRKIFYRPAVTMEIDSAIVFFGTGDREHPLNRAVVDRMYAIHDRGQTAALTETDLVDVTEDKIQAGNETEVSNVLNQLADAAKYGWYIRLDQNSGEKVLAQPLVYNKYAYYTTYAPDVVLNANVCDAGNLGTGRLYVVDYKTGAAVINYDKTNDSQYDSYKTNTYATPTDGTVLLRNDRLKTVGGGIPSPPVPITTAAGDTTIIIGCGGAICTGATGLSGGVLPIYWRQR